MFNNKIVIQLGGCQWPRTHPAIPARWKKVTAVPPKPHSKIRRPMDILVHSGGRAHDRILRAQYTEDALRSTSQCLTKNIVEESPLLTFPTISRHHKESHHIPSVPKALSDADSPKVSNVPPKDVFQQSLFASSRTSIFCAIRSVQSTPYQP